MREYWNGFFIGTVIGAGATVLYLTEKQKIQNTAKNMFKGRRYKVNDAMEDFSDAVNETLQRQG